MKILLTGTHFTPAKAVIEELLKRPDIQITYVGRATTMEGDDAPSSESLELKKLRIDYLTLIAGRLRNSLDLYTFISLLKIPIGILQALYIILTKRPDVILSFGGYVGVPIVFTGWLFSVPIILHEQGLSLGLANKISSIFADKIAVSFKDTNFQGRRTILTGNPLRKEILYPEKKMQKIYTDFFRQSQRVKLPVILITGGNQGSHAINVIVESCLQKLLEISYIIHQTGESKYKDFERLKERAYKRYLVTKWIDSDIGNILSKVDLVICRSGVNTLTELSYYSVPALTIPIPGHCEQKFNAEYFQKTGLTKVIYQKQLNEQNFLENINQMLKNLPSFRQKAKNTHQVIIVDAAKRLALETILLGIIK